MSDSAVALVAFGFFGLLAFFALLLVGGGAAFFFWKRQKKTVREEYYEAHQNHISQIGPMHPIQLAPQDSLVLYERLITIVQNLYRLHETSPDIVPSNDTSKVEKVEKVEKVDKVDKVGYEIVKCPHCQRPNIYMCQNECIQCPGCRKFNITIAPVETKKADDQSVPPVPSPPCIPPSPVPSYSGWGTSVSSANVLDSKDDKGKEKEKKSQ